MKNKRLPLVVILSISLFILPGCWDEVEIEDRAFIAAVAIDLAEDTGDETIIEMTEQIVVPAGLGTSTHPGTGKAYRNITRSGKSIYEINRDISRQESRISNVEHLGLIILSKEFAEQEGMLANILDVFIRQQYMRRGVMVAVTDTKAKDLLSVEVEHMKLPSINIIDMLEKDQTAVTKEPARSGDVQEKLLSKRSYVLPLLTILPDHTVEYEGIGVMAEEPSKLVGTLTDGDAKGRHFIIGKSQRGSVIAEVDGELVTFDIILGNSKYTLTNSDKNSLAFTVDIELTVSIREYFGTKNLYKEEVKKEFQNELEKEVKKLTHRALVKIKDEFQVDVLEFDRYLQIHHNKLWTEIKDNWDYGENYFSQSEVTINVKTNVREPGASVKIKAKGE